MLTMKEASEKKMLVRKIIQQIYSTVFIFYKRKLHISGPVQFKLVFESVELSY